MNTPLVSVIIPTKNSARTIQRCLNSIKNQTYANIECIVIDNFSSDKTTLIATAEGVKVFAAGNERSAQRNHGAKISKGEYLLFIDSDMELNPQVIENCILKMQRQENIKAITIPEKSFGIGFWAKCKAFERSFYYNTPWMNASRFMSRKTFIAIEGFDEGLIGGEDFDMQNKIIEYFGKASVATIQNFILHNEGRLTPYKLWQKKYYYGKTMLAYKYKKQNTKAFRTQTSIIKRIMLFSSQPQRIVRHPLLYAGTIVMKITEFIAGGLGYIAASHKS